MYFLINMLVSVSSKEQHRRQKTGTRDEMTFKEIKVELPLLCRNCREMQEAKRLISLDSSCNVEMSCLLLQTVNDVYSDHDVLLLS